MSEPKGIRAVTRRKATPRGWRCAVQPCTATEYVAHGWCRKHYQRWYRTGSPTTVGRPGPRPWTPDERAVLLARIRVTTSEHGMAA